ncbi:DUF262 domain-containing protein [Shewanella decolorationis]|uniref:DUF262 domain-containing protein n=1 Tax=Shewanella decolorationis TaxID=256839 RepID=UPI001A9F4525|nr:DUF262 domain-containing protein [Shewanella decolorationis]
MSLIKEIEDKRKEIFTDSYPMSIGELANLYRDGEIKINPAFQRFYRWTDTQKVRLIESILLGIPLPSIFVAQREDGVWDLVDGLQRVSTILSFMHVLKNETEQLVDPLVLSKTEYLPSLENVSWDGPNELDENIKRAFKREKLEIKIIKKESDANTKFELFQRLNTGGSNLSDQEVRNCLLVMLNEGLYQTLMNMSAYSSFVDSISITERLNEERYDMELVLRLLSLGSANEGQLLRIPDVSEFLTNSLKDMALASIDWAFEEQLFKDAFDIIYATLSDNAFRKYSNGSYRGGFQLSVYEVLSTGVYLYLKDQRDRQALPDLIKAISTTLCANPIFDQYSGSGSKANYRWPKLIPLAKNLFLK